MNIVFMGTPDFAVPCLVGRGRLSASAEKYLKNRLLCGLWHFAQKKAQILLLWAKKSSLITK